MGILPSYLLYSATGDEPLTDIVFETKAIHLESLTIVRLPREVSDGFPSRGMVMVEGIVDASRSFQP